MRVSPGAPRPGVVGRHGDGWKVRVAAAPEAGKANAELLGLLADTLEVGADRLELVAGRAARDKIVALHGMSAGEADARLEAAVGARS